MCLTLQLARALVSKLKKRNKMQPIAKNNTKGWKTTKLKNLVNKIDHILYTQFDKKSLKEWNAGLPLYSLSPNTFDQKQT